MRNSVVIVLLLVFAFNFGGYHWLLKYQQNLLRKEIKHKIKQGVSEDELVLITVNSENRDQLEWKDHEEFSYKGEMYDVVYTEVINESTVVYHALEDAKEHELIAKYTEKLKKNQNQRNQRNSALKFFKVLLKIPPAPIHQEVIVFEEHPKSHFNYTNLYHSVLLEITSPPPKSV